MKRNLLLLLLLLLPVLTLCAGGCNDDDDDNDDSCVKKGSIAVSIDETYQNSYMALSCVVKYTSAASGIATARFGIGDELDKSWYIGEVEAGEDARATVVGMRADTEYNIAIEVSNEDAQGISAPISCTTGSLPEDVPEFTVETIEQSEESDGFFFLPFFSPSPIMVGFILVIDSEGNIVFFHRVENAFVFDLEFDEDRNIYYSVESPLGAHYVAKISLTGEELGHWDAHEIGGLSYHHEIELTPEGDIMLLGLDKRPMDFPRTIRPEELDDPEKTPPEIHEIGDKSVNVVGDQIFTFTHEGELVLDTVGKSWSMWDHFDPAAEPYGGPSHGSLDANFWAQYLADLNSFDWTHANAIIPDWENETMILSIRHFSSLINVDMATGDVIWEMGKYSDDFTLSGSADDWFIRQHAPEILPDGNLLMYDNGYSLEVTADMGASFPNDVRPYSRVIEYEVDWDAKTMSKVWEYRESPDFYSDAMGDVDLLDSGNILVTSSQEGDIYGDGQWARIFITTHEETPKKLWEFKALGWSVYRAEWFPSMQPQTDDPPEEGDSPADCQ